LTDQPYADWPAPSLENMQRVGAKDATDFFQIGGRLFDAIQEEIKIATGRGGNDLDVLDFGCGCGRVAIPYVQSGLSLTGCDVDASAIKFLNDSYPSRDFQVTEYDPPLPFADASFDVVYSVSVWTHMDQTYGVKWLHEIKRILKPGGVFLNTVMGHTSLVYRHLQQNEDWGATTNRELRDAGVLFREYAGYASAPEKFPGIAASYGATFYDNQYIESNWRDVFSSVDILPGRMSGQDLVILRKRAG